MSRKEVRRSAQGGFSLLEAVTSPFRPAFRDFRERFPDFQHHISSQRNHIEGENDDFFFFFLSVRGGTIAF